MDLGWIGVGFVAIDPAEPCIVRSRALQLLRDESGNELLSNFKLFEKDGGRLEVPKQF